jgi:Mrp family chromosome partitioning ATPase
MCAWACSRPRLPNSQDALHNAWQQLLGKREEQLVPDAPPLANMTAKSVMVLGTTSGAGKSWLTTALCRYYARQGLKVAPFKAQNMSNNARVVAQGEIGSAQYFQALAANAVPDVRMNPLLLKPEKDTQSQVVLMGQVNAELSRMEWRGRSARSGRWCRGA